MPKLGYGKKWQNFEGVIKKAMAACTETGNIIELHFTDASKSSPMPHGGVREIKNYYLSRLACYLIAMNGDPRKQEIAAAQVYFAVTTRAHEIHQLRMEQEQRLETRLKVSESFKLLAETAQGAGVLSENFGIFVDAGYLGLHHHTVEELKTLKSIPEREEQDLHTLACSLMCQALEEPEPGWSKAAPGHHVEANARPGFTQETTLVNIKGTANLTLFQRGDEGINRKGCHGLVACRSAHSQLYRDARHGLRVRCLQHSDEVVFPK